MFKGQSADQGEAIFLRVASRGLVWEDWHDVFIVYQPSSAETHIFNETTAFILKCLEQGTLSTDELKKRTEDALGIGQSELSPEDFAFATARLDELGLIECLDRAIAV